jgi:N-acylneuraminate cytidylyltransferase
MAVIPARGGSRRIPRKNTRTFCGRPMMAWSIETATRSGIFDRIIVSTDDTQVAAIALAEGADVPFMRPAALADDHTGTGAVVAHAARWALDQGWTLEAVCCIYPTAPFLDAGDLRRGAEALATGDWQYAVSVTDFAAPVQRAFTARDGGGLAMLFPEHQATRSQDLPRVFHDAAQFYWGRPAAWLDGCPIFDRWTQPVFIPRWRVQDIDNEDDWTRAELMFDALQERRS